MPALAAGLDEFLARAPSRRRLGWLANAGAVERRTFRFGPDEALRRGHEIVRLFAPEHGVDGVAPPGAPVAHGRDPVTGLPVWSLYGESGTEEDAASLEGLDGVVVDLLDLGARHGTYAATAARLLETVARGTGIEVLVLDRPNPLGRATEGPLLRPGFESLVGLGPVPIRHGLTLGELLLWHVRGRDLQVPLEVIPVRGWDSRVISPPTPFIPPSPNLNVFEAQLLYPGICLFEGTNLSEGRGTTTPFQVVGAPWLDSARLLERLVDASLEGVALRHVCFEPRFSKHRGELCQGIFIHVVDRERVRPVALACHLLATIFRESHEARVTPAAQAGGRQFLDLLWGSPELRETLEAGEPPPETEPAETLGFHAAIARDLLYEAA